MTSYLTSNLNQLPLKKPFEGNIKCFFTMYNNKNNNREGKNGECLGADSKEK